MRGYQPTEKITSSSLPKGGSSGDKGIVNKSELTEVIGKLFEEVRKDKDVFATIYIFENEISIGIYHYESEKEYE